MVMESMIGFRYIPGSHAPCRESELEQCSLLTSHLAMNMEGTR